MTRRREDAPWGVFPPPRGARNGGAGTWTIDAQGPIIYEGRGRQVLAEYKICEWFRVVEGRPGARRAGVDFTRKGLYWRTVEVYIINFVKPTGVDGVERRSRESDTSLFACKPGSHGCGQGGGEAPLTSGHLLAFESALRVRTGLRGRAELVGSPRPVQRSECGIPTSSGATGRAVQSSAPRSSPGEACASQV
jgi:hypothetical protein